jgi:hypothetical protein
MKKEINSINSIELLPSFCIGLMIGTGAIVFMLIAGVIAWWIFA